METGVIISWNDAKGYGFIARPGKADVFVHSSSLPDNWWPSIGDKVSFDTIRVEGRPRESAVNVQVIAACDESGGEP